MGHVNHYVISFLNRKCHLSLTSLLPSPSLCSTCQLVKSHRLSYSHNERRSSHVLDLIHCDLWGPSPIKSNSSFLYYVIFIDDYSRFTWLYPLKFKYHFFDIFLRFQNFVENQYSSRIKVFQSDRDTKFTRTSFKTHLRTSGIYHQLSCPYTPSQNSRVERKHHHVTETGLSLLFHSHLSPRFWVDALGTAANIINRLPTPLLGGKSPFELIYGYSLHYDNFHPFGCRVYPYLRDYMSNKLSPPAFLVFFWVIVLLIKGSVVLIPPPLSYISSVMLNLMKLTILLFLAPMPNLFPLLICQISWKHIFTILIHLPTTSSSHISRSSSSPCDICSDLVDESVQVDTSRASSALPPSTSDPTSMEPTIDSSSLGSHPMITRAKVGIFKTRHPAILGILGSSGLISAVLASTRPKGFKYAAKNPAWVAAMDEEILASQQNDT